jgi:glycosyltransferase involved in cell wall biosynthesis
MIIGIDGNEANIKNRVGVNHYAYQILLGLKKLQDEGQFKHQIIVYLKNHPLDDMPKESSSYKYHVLPGGGMWIIKRLTPYLIRNRDHLDLMFSPSHYVPLLSSIPRICSIMDLGYLEFSGQFKKSDYWQLRLWSAYSILVSKAIISISNSTKEDIVRRYPFASKKVFVTHLGYDEHKYYQDVNKEDVRRIKEKYAIVGDYVVFLSTLKPSKNIEGLIEAFKSVSQEYKDIKLVIAGKKGWLYETIFEKVKKLSLENRIIFTDFIPEEDKPSLVAGAKVFVLPSFWEGFGLDILSAMACGVPVVASNKGSLPEVVSEAGILVDPYKPEEIASGIKKVLSMGTLEYNKLIEAGFNQAKKFTWEEMVRKTVQVFERFKK